jgi:hypothetical protein
LKCKGGEKVDKCTTDLTFILFVVVTYLYPHQSLFIWLDSAGCTAIYGAAMYFERRCADERMDGQSCCIGPLEVYSLS